MIVEAIELLNFTSFKGRHSFSLAPYQREGLFAITGNTGSGKSSLLSAISLALYGRHHKAQLSGGDFIHRGEQLAYVKVTVLLPRPVSCEWRADRKKNPISRRSYTALDSGEPLSIGEFETLLKIPFIQFCHSVVINQGDFARYLLGTFPERRLLIEKLVPQEDILRFSKNLKESERVLELGLRAKEALILGTPYMGETDYLKLLKKRDECDKNIKKLSSDAREMEKFRQILNRKNEHEANLESYKEFIAKKELEKNALKKELNDCQKKLKEAEEKRQRLFLKFKESSQERGAIIHLLLRRKNLENEIALKKKKETLKREEIVVLETKLKNILERELLFREEQRLLFDEALKVLNLAAVISDSLKSAYKRIQEELCDVERKISKEGIKKDANELICSRCGQENPLLKRSILLKREENLKRKLELCLKSEKTDWDRESRKISEKLIEAREKTDYARLRLSDLRCGLKELSQKENLEELEEIRIKIGLCGKNFPHLDEEELREFFRLEDLVLERAESAVKDLAKVEQELIVRIETNRTLLEGKRQDLKRTEKALSALEGELTATGKLAILPLETSENHLENNLNNDLDFYREELARLKERIERYLATKAFIDKKKEELKIFQKHYEGILRLKNSIGTDTLRHYAIGLVEENVLAYANHELKCLREGRFKILRLDNERGGSDLYIEDLELGGRERKAFTLSGGETFIVSLALALGLSAFFSDLYGFSGAHLSGLFIDEGFGSLDSESLSEVCEILFRLAAEGRSIGVITHVKDFSDLLPARLELGMPRKTRERNHVSYISKATDIHEYPLKSETEA